MGSNGNQGSKRDYSTYDFCALTIVGTDTTVASLGATINTLAFDGDFFISPDESYIIISSKETPTYECELWISFRKKDKISFAWIIEPNGSLTFLKMLSLKDDIEVMEEVKRIVSLMPNYAPAFCGKKKVPYIMDFSIGVESLKKSQQ